MYTKTSKKQCGSHTFHSINCHNKIRKVSQNKFEVITLLGRHAFKYTVVTRNKCNNDIKAVTFPTRKQALCFFMMSVKKYN